MLYSQLHSTATTYQNGVVIRCRSKVVAYFRQEPFSINGNNHRYYGFIDNNEQWYETDEPIAFCPYWNSFDYELGGAIMFELDSTIPVHKLDKPKLPLGKVEGYEAWHDTYIAHILNDGCNDIIIHVYNYDSSLRWIRWSYGRLNHSGTEETTLYERREGNFLNRIDGNILEQSLFKNIPFEHDLICKDLGEVYASVGDNLNKLAFFAEVAGIKEYTGTPEPIMYRQWDNGKRKFI